MYGWACHWWLWWEEVTLCNCLSMLLCTFPQGHTVWDAALWAPQREADVLEGSADVYDAGHLHHYQRTAPRLQGGHHGCRSRHAWPWHDLWRGQVRRQSGKKRIFQNCIIVRQVKVKVIQVKKRNSKCTDLRRPWVIDLITNGLNKLLIATFEHCLMTGIEFYLIYCVVFNYYILCLLFYFRFCLLVLYVNNVYSMFIVICHINCYVFCYVLDLYVSPLRSGWECKNKVVSWLPWTRGRLSHFLHPLSVQGRKSRSWELYFTGA